MLIVKSCFAVSIVALSVLALGCHTTEPRSPDVGLTQPIDPPKPPELGRGAPRQETQEAYRIFLGEGIGGLCAGPAPYYDTARAKAN